LLGRSVARYLSLQAADVTGNGVDELLACCWDGTTYIYDSNFDCCVFGAEGDVLAFIACPLTLSAQEEAVPQLCLVYATNSFISIYCMDESAAETRKRNGEASFSLELRPPTASHENEMPLARGPRPISHLRPPTILETLHRCDQSLLVQMLGYHEEPQGEDDSTSERLRRLRDMVRFCTKTSLRDLEQWRDRLRAQVKQSNLET